MTNSTKTGKSLRLHALADGKWTASGELTVSGGRRATIRAS
jgi:hypothetical protein